MNDEKNEKSVVKKEESGCFVVSVEQKWEMIRNSVRTVVQKCWEFRHRQQSRHPLHL